MKRLIRPTAILVIGLLVALLSAAVTHTGRTEGSGYSATTSYFLDTAPAQPLEDDQSVMGSTDGIVAMGGIIVLIILIPIVVQRKSWMRAE